MLRLRADHVAELTERYTDRTVLVTGGAGFIGGHLVDALLGVGARVRVIDDLSNATAAHIAEQIDLEPDRVRFIHASILDADAIEEASVGAATVFHLAAIGSVQRSIEHPQRTWDVNATGTSMVFEAARRVNAERVVLAASSSAYGDTPTLPKTEGMPASPLSPYAASKLAGEQIAASWAHVYDIDAVCLRYFNVFGPRQRADSAYAAVVPAFTARLLAGERPTIFGDGRQSRDFTYIANVVLATLRAGVADRPLAGAAVNIGGGEQTDLLTLASTLAAHLDRPDLTPEHEHERAGDVKHSLADLGRAKELLGYEPFVTVTEGLAQTVEAMRRSAAAAGG